MAVPLISASFIQMAYSMTDMLWLGHLGSDAVAAAGAAGFFTWLCNALSFMTKIGAEITVSNLSVRKIIAGQLIMPVRPLPYRLQSDLSMPVSSSWQPLY